jgi:hypothetical protein
MSGAAGPHDRPARLTPINGARVIEIADPVAALARIAARSHVEPAPLHVPPELGDCLVWDGGCNPKGYGRIRVADAMHLVHRLAWIARHGEPPPDTPIVCHHCDVPACWADAHLYAGTHAQNAADREARHRNAQTHKTHCPAGHRYDAANTITHVRANGWRARVCRKCWNAGHAANRRRARARAAAERSGPLRDLVPVPLFDVAELVAR